MTYSKKAELSNHPGETSPIGAETAASRDMSPETMHEPCAMPQKVAQMQTLADRIHVLAFAIDHVPFVSKALKPASRSLAGGNERLQQRKLPAAEIVRNIAGVVRRARFITALGEGCSYGEISVGTVGRARDNRHTER